MWLNERLNVKRRHLCLEVVARVKIIEQIDKKLQELTIFN